MSKDRSAWFVWQAWHDKYHARIIYDALPESYEGKSGWSHTPIELKGEDLILSLSELMEKYPQPPEQTK